MLRWTSRFQNSISTALTPHPCTTNGPCTGNTTCGTGESRYDGYCDKDGCDFNPYRWGAQNFFGPGKTVDSKQKMTVVTQFMFFTPFLSFLVHLTDLLYHRTSDNTATGTLSAIRRLYVQNGKVIQQANTNVAGITQTNQITDSFCKQQKAVTGDPDSFSQKGGLAGFSKDLDACRLQQGRCCSRYLPHYLWQAQRCRISTRQRRLSKWQDLLLILPRKTGSQLPTMIRWQRTITLVKKRCF